MTGKDVELKDRGFVKIRDVTKAISTELDRLYPNRIAYKNEDAERAWIKQCEVCEIEENYPSNNTLTLLLRVLVGNIVQVVGEPWEEKGSQRALFMPSYPATTFLDTTQMVLETPKEEEIREYKDLYPKQRVWLIDPYGIKYPRRRTNSSWLPYPLRPDVPEKERIHLFELARRISMVVAIVEPSFERVGIVPETDTLKAPMIYVYPNALEHLD